MPLCAKRTAHTLYRFNLEAGKAAALGHTWLGATHVPDLGRKGRKEEKKVEREKKISYWRYPGPWVILPGPLWFS